MRQWKALRNPVPEGVFPRRGQDGGANWLTEKEAVRIVVEEEERAGAAYPSPALGA